MPFRTLTVILAALCLAACASAPKPVATGIETEKTLRPLRDEAYATSERFVDAPRVQAATSVGLPQVRIGLTRGGHVALNLGAEIPLSDQSYDARYYAQLLWDFADGSFFKGW